jgi:hypothetical protein
LRHFERCSVLKICVYLFKINWKTPNTIFYKMKHVIWIHFLLQKYGNLFLTYASWFIVHFSGKNCTSLFMTIIILVVFFFTAKMIYSFNITYSEVFTNDLYDSTSDAFKSLNKTLSGAVSVPSVNNLSFRK